MLTFREGQGTGKRKGRRTENKFLGGRQHVQREGDFVLVAFALEPAEEGVCVEHGVNLRFGGPRGF